MPFNPNSWWSRCVPSRGRGIRDGLRASQKTAWLWSLAKAPVLWPPDAKSCLLGKAPETGKVGRREEKGTTEDEMLGWHHRLDGQELARAPGAGDGQGSLACCSPRGVQRVGLG